MHLNNLTVRAQPALAFGILAALVLRVAGLALKSLTDANSRFTGHVHGINARALMADAVRTQIAEGSADLSQRTEEQESAAAAESLKQQAQGLVSAVAVFKLAAAA